MMRNTSLNAWSGVVNTEPATAKPSAFIRYCNRAILKLFGHSRYADYSFLKNVSE